MTSTETNKQNTPSPPPVVYIVGGIVFLFAIIMAILLIRYAIKMSKKNYPY